MQLFDGSGQEAQAPPAAPEPPPGPAVEIIRGGQREQASMPRTPGDMPPGPPGPPPVRSWTLDLAETGAVYPGQFTGETTAR